MTSFVKKTLRGGLLALLSANSLLCQELNAQDIQAIKNSGNIEFIGRNLNVGEAYSVVSTTNILKKGWEKWDFDINRFGYSIASSPNETVSVSPPQKKEEFFRLFNLDRYYGPVSEIISHKNLDKVNNDEEIEVRVKDILPMKEVSLYVMQPNGKFNKINTVLKGELKFNIPTYLFSNGTNTLFVESINEGFYYPEYQQNRPIKTYSSLELVFNNLLYEENYNQITPYGYYMPSFVSKKGKMSYNLEVLNRNNEHIKTVSGESYTDWEGNERLEPYWDFTDTEGNIVNNQSLITRFSVFELEQNQSKGIPQVKVPIVKTNYFDPGVFGYKYFITHEHMALHREIFGYIEDYLVSDTANAIWYNCWLASTIGDVGLKQPYDWDKPYKFTEHSNTNQINRIIDSVGDTLTSGVYMIGHGNNLATFDNALSFDAMGAKMGNTQKQTYHTNANGQVTRELNYQYNKRMHHSYFSTCDSTSGPGPEELGTPRALDQVSSGVTKTAYMGYSDFALVNLGALNWDRTFYNYFYVNYPVSYAISMSQQEYPKPVNEWGFTLYGYPDLIYKY